MGPASDEEPEILVNGHQVQVHKNLRALLHIRTGEDRCLWIDALCINQADLLERNHQVRLMSRIYGEASHVIAWLGLADNDSDLAIEALKRLVALCMSEGSRRIYIWTENGQS